ncbi:MAG: potassium channel family protein [Pseudomonadota bacterium]
MITDEYLVVAVVTACIVLFSAYVHYEGLRIITDRLPSSAEANNRRRVLLSILLLLLLHVIQIWIFGLAYLWLLEHDGYGSLQGLSRATLIDSIYFSAMVYTTIGFGDLYPTGAIRLMAGMEGITGLTMITWSASYTFVEMGKDWHNND